MKRVHQNQDEQHRHYAEPPHHHLPDTADENPPDPFSGMAMAGRTCHYYWQTNLFVAVMAIAAVVIAANSNWNTAYETTRRNQYQYHYQLDQCEVGLLAAIMVQTF